MLHAQEPKNKIANWIAFISLGIVAIAIGIFLYWSTQGSKILEVKEIPIPIRTIKDPSKDSLIVILNVNYCKYRDIDGNLRMSFISDTREVFLPLVRERGDQGCKQSELPVVIPKDLAPDTYKVKFRVVYEVNPIKTVVNEFVTKEFTVDGAK